MNMNFIELTLNHDNYRPCKHTIYVSVSSIVLLKPAISREERGSQVRTLTSGSYPLSVDESVDEILSMIEGTYSTKREALADVKTHHPELMGD